MQAIGVVFLTAAIWFLYCGTHGLNPIKLLQAVIKSPDKAGDAVTQAIKDAEDSKYAWTSEEPGFSGGGSLGSVVANPWASRQVTAPFGQSNHVGVIGSAHVHNGIDYAMPVGTHLPAVLTGTATEGFGVLSGTTLTITGTGAYKGWSTIYMHLSHVVKTGAVTSGDIVAESGGQQGAEGSGDSTGPHLHFEVHKNGAVVNPASFWQWVSVNSKNLEK